MGYDLHVARAWEWFHGERYPISVEEWLHLVERSDDLWFEPTGKGTAPDRPGDDVMCFWNHADQVEWLCYDNGTVYSKNPHDALVSRMIAVASELDAWVMGEEGERYAVAPDGRIVSSPPAEPSPGLFRITRTRPGEMGWERPIPEPEWLALAARQHDFRVEPRVRATLPSGTAWIPRSPLAHWCGHEPPVPFFVGADGIEFEPVDERLVDRATALAAALGARVVDGCGDTVD